MPLPGEGVVNPRDEIMAEIHKSRHEQLEKEFKEGGGDLSILEPADKKEEPKPEVKEEAKPEEEVPPVEGEAKPEEEKPEEPVKAKVKIKVDGQELEVEEDAVREAGIKALQKQSAADKRLEESARLKKEAEAEARRI